MRCPWRLAPWLPPSTVRWRCELGQHSVESTTAVPDPANATWLVTCPGVSQEMATSANWSVVLKARLVGGRRNRVVEYPPLRFCSAHSPKQTVVACTEVLATAPGARRQLREWAAAHHTLFDRLYVFANDAAEGGVAAATSALQPLVNVGKVVVVDWAWKPKPAADWAEQPAAEVACIRRLRGLAKWVALIDIDEFFLCTDNNTSDGSCNNGSFATWVARQFGSGAGGTAPVVAALSVPRLEFAAPPRVEDVLEGTSPATAALPAIGRWTLRKESPTTPKSIVDPLRVVYHFVHHPTLVDPPTAVIRPTSTATSDYVLLHYKQFLDIATSATVRDTRAMSHATTLQGELARLFGKVWYTS